MPVLDGCVLCQAPIIDHCGECGARRLRPTHAERGIRLSNGQHVKVAFCADCLRRATPAQFPAILAGVRRQFEALWQREATPEASRALLREQWSSWRPVGWADEIEGLEHALGRQRLSAADLRAQITQLEAHLAELEARGAA